AHLVARAGLDQRDTAARMQHEAVDRHARRRGAIGLFQDALGVLRRDVAHEIVRGIEVAVADRRHDDVADAAAVDAGDLRRRDGAHVFRSATNRGAIFSTSASRPTMPSAVSDSATNCFSRALAPSRPSTLTNVPLPSAASVPVALPTVAASPSTSSRSSAIWKASPSSVP